MSRIAVFGESPVVDGWALAGSLVVTAAGEAEVGRAWERLPEDIEVVVVTSAAAALLGDRAAERMVVVLP